MADVFISYARLDQESAKRLADAIESRGWTVWWDRRIPVGKSYEDVIQQAIDDAGCVVVLWTGKSVASEWVRNEASEAARRKVLIPIRLEEVRVPLSFRHLQAADLFGWTSAEVENCLGSIEAMIGSPASRRASEPSLEHQVGVSVPADAVAPPVEPSSPSPAETTSMSSGFKRKVWIGVAISVGLVVLILSDLGRKKEVSANTHTGSMAKDISGTVTDTMATTSDIILTTDTTSTSATVSPVPPAGVSTEGSPPLARPTTINGLEDTPSAARLSDNDAPTSAANSHTEAVQLPHAPSNHESPTPAPLKERDKNSQPSTSSPRFVQRGDDVILDNDTGLEWTKEDNGTDIDWESARRYCTDRSGGWRLPTVQELDDIIETNEANRCQVKYGQKPTKCRVSALFVLTRAGFWSSESANGGEAVLVDFVHGGHHLVKGDDESAKRVLCVRQR